ncbi:hypothetical protein C8Q79DRAFT_1012118 [Trametes meyenii]|nr:hypothetical protein C8Q79DRAFT_1012118 [Trametes meyenii]
MPFLMLYDSPQDIYGAGSAMIAVNANGTILQEAPEDENHVEWDPVHVIVTELAPNFWSLLVSWYTQDRLCANLPEATVSCCLDDSFQWTHDQRNLVFRCKRGINGDFFLKIMAEPKFWDLAKIFTNAKIQLASWRSEIKDLIDQSYRNFPQPKASEDALPDEPVVDEAGEHVGHDDDEQGEQDQDEQGEQDQDEIEVAGILGV